MLIFKIIIIFFKIKMNNFSLNTKKKKKKKKNYYFIHVYTWGLYKNKEGKGFFSPFFFTMTIKLLPNSPVN